MDYNRPSNILVYKTHFCITGKKISCIKRTDILEIVTAKFNLNLTFVQIFPIRSDKKKKKRICLVHIRS